MAKIEVNPWLTMLYKPRSTIRQIIKYDPNYMVIFIAVANSFLVVNLIISIFMSFVNSIFLAIFLGPLTGILLLYITGRIFKITGNWFGGKASASHIRAALAWSSIPLLYSLLLSNPTVHLLKASIGPLSHESLTLVLIISLTVGNMWSSWLSGSLLEEVQGFSFWRAYFYSIIAFTISISIILLIIIPVLGSVVLVIVSQIYSVS